MPVDLTVPRPEAVDAVLTELASWQRDGLPVQLHPGDLGWHQRFGAGSLADGLRIWSSDGVAVAIGFLDGASLVRLALSPSVDHDENLAEALARDLEDPARGVLAGDRVMAEVRFGTALRARLRRRGWGDGDVWTPLVRELREPVEGCALRLETAGPDERVADRVAVQRAAFDGSTFTVELWAEMSQSAAYRQARCLVGYDRDGNAVAATTVWSAGPGRPGLIEPLGVHRDHRGHGYGRSITLAAAAALRDLEASSATVATPATNTGAVATYASAGFRRLPDVTDYAFTR